MANTALLIPQPELLHGARELLARDEVVAVHVHGDEEVLDELPVGAERGTEAAAEAERGVGVGDDGRGRPERVVEIEGEQPERRRRGRARLSLIHI